MIERNIVFKSLHRVDAGSILRFWGNNRLKNRQKTCIERFCVIADNTIGVFPITLHSPQKKYKKSSIWNKTLLKFQKNTTNVLKPYFYGLFLDRKN